MVETERRAKIASLNRDSGRNEVFEAERNTRRWSLTCSLSLRSDRSAFSAGHTWILSRSSVGRAPASGVVDRGSVGYRMNVFAYGASRVR
jgi:hypothetical protein